MSVTAVVRKDFRDGIRSRLLWALMALFVLTVGGFALITVTQSSSPDGDAIALIGLMGFSAVLAVIFLVPITGLVVSIKSIVRERELGSIKILLSLPHSRGEVIIGKFLGRSGLLAVAILAGFLPAALLFAIRFGNFPVFEYAAFLLVIILFGVVFVAVGVGVSALLKTETRATIAGIGIFFLLYFWSELFSWVNDQIGLLSGDGLLFVERFHLFIVFFDAFFALLSLRYDEISSASVVTEGFVFDIDPETGREIASQPFYLQHWFAFVILGIWITVPLAIGYYRFARADL